jgi:hypothetical protein
MCVCSAGLGGRRVSHPMEVMDGGTDNSSPLIKPPSYRYDLRSKGLRMKYAVLAVIAASMLVGCAASVKQV